MPLLTDADVAAKLNMEVTQFKVFQRKNKTFPAAIRLTERTLRWDEDEVDTWLSAKKEEKNGDGF